MENIFQWLSFISNIFTVVASGIAIYLFIAKRGALKSAFSLLVNYSYHLTLSEIKEKIERLNEYSAKDPGDREKILHILHEIIGQIKGNEKLRKVFSSMLEDIENVASDKRRITEPYKRSMVSEMRERLRNVDAENIDSLIGDSDQ